MNIIFGCIMSLIVMLTILVITAGIATRVEEGKITLRTPRKMIIIFILRFILYANVIYNFYTSIFWAAVCSNIKISEAPPVEVLLSFMWIIFIILAWIFIACYFAHETGVVGLIPSYNEQKAEGQKISYKVFKNFYILYPNHVAILDDAFFIKNPKTFNPEERFCFGFLDFIKVMLFLARQQEPILEKPNTSATLLMQQIIDEDIKQNSAKMRAAAQETIKIINNMER